MSLCPIAIAAVATEQQAIGAASEDHDSKSYFPNGAEGDRTLCGALSLPCLLQSGREFKL